MQSLASIRSSLFPPHNHRHNLLTHNHGHPSNPHNALPQHPTHHHSPHSPPLRPHVLPPRHHGLILLIRPSGRHARRPTPFRLPSPTGQALGRKQRDRARQGGQILPAVRDGARDVRRAGAVLPTTVRPLLTPPRSCKSNDTQTAAISESTDG
jgi:hypothetical protein